jgi:uncharacterized protein (DUF488 family)
MMDWDIASIGHSNNTIEEFIEKLEHHGITAVADVRSVPYSGRMPWFCRDTIKASLASKGISYVWMGEQLGGRPSRPELLTSTRRADYVAMAREPSFRKGLDRLIDGSMKYRVAMMCSEADPMQCHRCLLVGRFLSNMRIRISHILKSCDMISQEDVEKMLLNKYSKKIIKDDLDSAYAFQAERHAFHAKLLT